MRPEVAELFYRLADLPPAEQQRILQEEVSDAELREEVRQLLAYDRPTEGGFLQEAVADNASVLREDLTDEGLLPKFGAYQSIRLLGRGGMGAVYLAERKDDAVEHRAAVKVLPFATREMQRRFQEERQILAKLEHSNIAGFLDAGVSNGVPYLAMEYVDGVPLDVYCLSSQASVHEVLRLFLKVADAVDYAHRNLILHRDLKPQNILVTAQGEPKLLDFGIGKILRETGADETRTALYAMTPDYASPEQVRGQAVSVSTDVYSLGAVLYRLLTGRKPHQLTGTSPAEVERAICEGEVTRPSAIRKELRGDLENVVLRALHKDPLRRYQSVADFAADLRRYLERRPVLATPDSLGYRMSRFFARNRNAVVFASIAGIALVLAAGYAVLEGRRASRRSEDIRKLSTVLLFDVEKAIRNVPGAVDGRKIVVTTGLQLLDRLRTDARGDRALAADLADAYVKMADAQSSLTNASAGNTKEAIESLRRAVDLYGEAGGPRGQNRDVRARYFTTVATLAASLDQTMDSDAALQLLTEAAPEADRWVKDFPTDPTVLQAASRIWFHTATVSFHKGKLDAAIAAAEKDVALQNEVVRLGGPSPEALESLGSSYFQMSDTLRDSGRIREAIAAGRKAVEVFTKLAAGPGGDAYPVQRKLMIAHTYLGNALQVLADDSDREALRECVETLAKASRIVEHAIQSDPSNMLALSDHAIATQALALIQNTSRDRAASLQSFSRAIDSARRFYDRNKTRRGQLILADNLFKKAAVHVECDQPAEALRLLAESRELVTKMLDARPDDTRTMTMMLAVDRYEAAARAKAGDKAQARVLYVKAMAAVAKLLTRDPNDATVKIHESEIRKEVAQLDRAAAPR